MLSSYVSHVITIKYQKRGLLYIYLLLNIKNSNFSQYTLANINEVIYTKLPKPSQDPSREIFNLVTSYIVYLLYRVLNPNTPYIRNKNSSKSDYYSKEFLKPQTKSTTIPNDDAAYSKYYKRDNSIKYKVKNLLKLGTFLNIDNRQVVLYNPQLLYKF